MKHISTSIFIVLMIFSQKALGGSIGQALDDIRFVFSKVKRISMGRPTEPEVLRRLYEIEERLGFDLERSPFLAGMNNLVKNRFNPLKNKKVREAFDGEDTETFRTVLFEHIKEKHLDSSIVLRWWDDQGFRNTVFPHLSKEHLSSPLNPTLLLKWWDEAVSRGVEDQLELFVEQRFGNMNFQPKTSVQFSDGFFRGAINDPFIRTVFIATMENEGFARHIEQIMENLAKKKNGDQSHQDW